MRSFVRLLVTALAMWTAALSAADVPPAGTIQQDGTTLAWKPAAAPFPPGMETVVLEGDPRTGEIFTLRLRAPAGARLAPHVHPLPERVTVIQGAIGVGFGTAYDQTRMRVFRAGDYYVNPPGAPHFVGFIEDSVLQVTGRGPWGVEWVSP
ncbi:MAG: hypothetical protein K0Q76_2576 [Panacagrimonas sp.]|nr:hypothetical protein [Panacagrimonas sp.]